LRLRSDYALFARDSEAIHGSGFQVYVCVENFKAAGMCFPTPAEIASLREEAIVELQGGLKI
jgi:hypothetical protein